MNDTVISINGIAVHSTPIRGEQTTDTSHLVSFKDAEGNKCYIYITNRTITDVQWIKLIK